MRKQPTLTEVQRQARRETIMRTKPWEKSTGPKTAEGKAVAAQRWRKHGLRSGEAIAAQQWVSSVRRLLRALARRKALYTVILVIAPLIPTNLAQYF